MRLITSQHYLDDEIVQAKREAQDYEVLVSPELEVDGDTYRVVIDGHHSLAAAMADGVDPVLVEASVTDHDAVGLLEDGDVETFLEALWMDGEYIDAVTRAPIW